VKVVFLIRSLDRGGAERQLVLLAHGLQRLGHHVSVLVFYGGGCFEPELLASGIQVAVIGKRSRWESLSFLRRARLCLASEKPDVIHSYLGGANIVAATLKPWLSNVKIVWGLRAARLAFRESDLLSRLSAWAEVLLSRVPDLIIANSEAGKRYATRVGFPEGALAVVPNGIDLRKFNIDSESRGRFRSTFGISNHEVVIGRVGRMDPVKDYPGFLRMASIIAKQNPGIRFLCIGGGSNEYVAQLRALASDLGIGGSVTWAGAVDEMPAAYNSLDLLVSTSVSEGFPNVLLEAMACGVPCVTTDVGDSKQIVEGTGVAVAYGNDQELADACLKLLSSLPDKQRVRKRIVDHFGLEQLVCRTEQHLIRLVGHLHEKAPAQSVAALLT
jgi:glycosyltransferase involved in cell wall biosynthesis